MHTTIMQSHHHSFLNSCGFQQSIPTLNYINDLVIYSAGANMYASITHNLNFQYCIGGKIYQYFLKLQVNRILNIRKSEKHITSDQTIFLPCYTFVDDPVMIVSSG